ncbi:hypothetical protein F443_22848, partial [Phytophthora nicotianae P1569]
AQDKLSSIASLLPSALGHKRTRSESESPTQSARVSKAARSTSSLPQACTSSPAPVSRSSIELLSTAAVGQKTTKTVSSPSSAGPPGHPPRSVRSAAESGGGSASSPPAASAANVHSNGDESSSGESNSSHVFDSDVAGSDSGFPKSSGAKDEFGIPSGPLSEEELGDWRDDLVDESKVRDFIASAPWEVLAALLDPLMFKSQDWFRHMKQLYASYEAEHLRAYWDSTHAFPVSITKRRASRYLDAFYTDHKQRRSRAGAQWKPFLQQVLIGLLRGYCDLDLLLDPFFLHFPRPGEAGAWYPANVYGADPADLLEALTITGATDRWRNHYRDVPEDHPALEIARLRGKFLSSSS